MLKKKKLIQAGSRYFALSEFSIVNNDNTYIQFVYKNWRWTFKKGYMIRIEKCISNHDCKSQRTPLGTKITKHISLCLKIQVFILYKMTSLAFVEEFQIYDPFLTIICGKLCIWRHYQGITHMSIKIGYRRSWNSTNNQVSTVSCVHLFVTLALSPAAGIRKHCFCPRFISSNV